MKVIADESIESQVDSYPSPVNESAVDTSLSIVGQAHAILINSCGSCHQNSLPTQKAGALAVYDLDDTKNWYKEMTEEEFDGVERRLVNRDQFTEEQAEQMLLFLELARSELF